jgi:hypothetical protein
VDGEDAKSCDVFTTTPTESITVERREELEERVKELRAKIKGYTDGTHALVGIKEYAEAQALAIEQAERIKELEEMEDCHQKILNWIDAYPLEIFPEPDFEAVRFALASKGITVDSVSASNMRHVLKGIKEIIDSAKEK